MIMKGVPLWQVYWRRFCCFIRAQTMRCIVRMICMGVEMFFDENSIEVVATFTKNATKVVNFWALGEVFSSIQRRRPQTLINALFNLNLTKLLSSHLKLHRNSKFWKFNFPIFSWIFTKFKQYSKHIL